MTLPPLRREIFVWLHSLRRFLTHHRTLIPGAAACYAVLFGLLIYGVAVHARLESWREPPLPTAAGVRAPAPIPHAVAANCAEFAGMGQTPCNAIVKVEVAHAEFRPRFEAPKLRDIQPPVEQTRPALPPPALILLATEKTSEGGDDDEPLNQDDPSNLSIAYRK